MLPAASKRRPLALAVVAVFALAATDAWCAPPPVNSCADDSSPGTLRYAVLAADDNDTIDMSQLKCTTITLQTGAINVDQDDLKILGPGAANLTIDAGGTSRVFAHGGTGRFDLYGMTIANGHTAGTTRALGGCIYSLSGSVGIIDTVVTGCSVTATVTAGGGGIFAFNDVFLSGSVVTGNTATSTAATHAAAGYAVGGGVFSGGSARMISSRVENNHAHIEYGGAYGAGVYCFTSFFAKYSTIDGNVADVGVLNTMHSASSGGGIAFSGKGTGKDFFMEYSTVSHNRATVSAGLFAGGSSAEIYNSTLSGNVADYAVGAAFVTSPLKLYNSTIAFNTAGSYGGGGLMAGGATLKMSSTIIADNSPGGPKFAADLQTDAAITGDHNLVRFAGGMGVLPMDTLREDPMLDALRDNGGPTHTHALLPGSPAIDHGSNPAAFINDQRHFGFARAVGVTDIGAYEYDPDIVFVSGFE
jgi:hypothetical protein